MLIYICMLHILFLSIFMLTVTVLITSCIKNTVGWGAIFLETNIAHHESGRPGHVRRLTELWNAFFDSGLRRPPAFSTMAEPNGAHPPAGQPRPRAPAPGPAGGHAGAAGPAHAAPPAQPGAPAQGRMTAAQRYSAIRHPNFSLGQFGMAFKGLRYTEYLWGLNSTLLPPIDQRDRSPHLMTYVMILSKGEAVLMGSENPQQTCRCIAVANTAAIGIGEQLSATDATARNHLELWTFLRSDVGTGSEEIVRVSEPDLANPGFNPAITWWPTGRQGFQQLSQEPQFQGDEPARVLEWLAARATPYATQGGALIFTLAFISLAKRGTVEAAKLDRILRDARGDSGAALLLTPEDVRICYTGVLSRLPEECIGECLEHWVSLVDQSCLRLQLTLQQAKNSGLVILQCIRKALMLFPTFEWNKIAGWFPSDAANVAQAFQIVGDDKYYGFRRDLGPVRSTQYKSMAFVAKQLLLKWGGPEYGTLGNYRGWPATVPHASEIEAMVNAFNPESPMADNANQLIDEIKATITGATGLDP
uniref:Putative nucleoprotein n=1 Tax=Canne point virus TaxID=2485866 RepID=A0A3G3BTR0_9VIRU|nr:putative nucleoprotein [Canne point virus]